MEGFKGKTNLFWQQAAQNNVIRANYVKANIDKTPQDYKCKLCSDREKKRSIKWYPETQKEYITILNWVVKVIHWELCKTSKFDHSNEW